jgi:predicted methyltransferase
MSTTQIERGLFRWIAALAATVFLLAAQDRHPLTGRPIAPVMGVGGADWLERAERENEENPSKAIRLLGLKPGMTVCDLGAGTGYYSIRMAKIVGPQGKVYAVDIQQGMLDLLNRRLKKEKLANVETVLASEVDPHLPKGQVDMVLMVDVYHELSKPQEVLRKIREALKEDGRLVLLEFRKEDPAVPIRPEHKMSVDDVRTELAAEGFRIDKVVEDLPWQHLIFLRKAN